MIRLATLGLLLCAAASAQMQLLQVTGPGTEKELPAILSVGAAPVGENVSITLRVRNGSLAALVIRTLTLSGTGFTMSGQPSLPHQLAPGFNMDFTVRFSPRDYGSYSGNLAVNGVSVLLTGSSTAAPILSVAGTTLSSGSSVDMGLAERGTTTTKTFHVENTTSERVGVSTLTVTGKHFQLARAVQLPMELGPRMSQDFDVTFTPSASGVFEGALAIDGRIYRLTGSANEPPFPKPSIVVDLLSATSAQQGKISVRFGEASRAIGSGKLRLEFRPAATLATDDEAVRFTRGTARSATFEVAEGTTVPVPELTFQTGTTAGTIVFVAEVGGWTATANVEIGAERVRLDKTRAIRNGSMLEVEITGFDNTRTLDTLAFTFFSSKGETIQPGAIRINTATEFRRHFEGSAAGGAFALKAVFPVAGVINDIASTEVQLTNGSGSTASGKIQLQ